MMGMFDSLYKGDEEWQTKAYGCSLHRFRIGDRMPALLGCEWPAPSDYQVQILGERDGQDFVDSFATIRGGVLVSIDDEPDPSLPRADYSGWIKRNP